MPTSTCLQPRVVRVAACHVQVDDTPWAFARAETDAIDAHWGRRLSDNPALFNGVIHLMHRHSLADGIFTAWLLRTDFKSYLYWRDTGYRDDSVRDAFGSGLLRSRDGSVLLGRQTAGNVNAGLVYPPGGFIDHRDVGDDGHVDIVQSVRREIGEELGLSIDALDAEADARITFAGPLVSIAITFVSSLAADELVAHARRHIAAETTPELDEVVAVRSLGDLAGLPMPDFARPLLADVFG